MQKLFFIMIALTVVFVLLAVFKGPRGGAR